MPMMSNEHPNRHFIILAARLLAGALSGCLLALLLSGCTAAPSDAPAKDPFTSDATDGSSQNGTLTGDPAGDASSKEEASETRRELTEEEKRAEEMVRTIFDQYGSEGEADGETYLNLLENYGSSQSGYLWSNFCGVGMQYYMCKLYPGDEAQKERFRQMIDNFLFFRHGAPEQDQDEDSVKYHSARGSLVGAGTGDCFFDDNIWVARNYLRAYEILGDEWYLEEAIRVDKWVLSGWNKELGGVVWSEAGLSSNANEQQLERGLSANACSILVNATLSILSQDTQEKAFYLKWAKRFYRFCKKMQNLPDSYDYWNGIHTVYENGEFRNGSINKVHYSYNSGSMILANLALYDCMEEGEEKEAYLEDALHTAAAAYKTFLSHDPKADEDYFRGDPWFAAILNEGYYELWRHGCQDASKYLDAFAQNVSLAYSNRDEKTRLCPYQATQEVTWEKNEAYVIHQVGFAQQAVLAALYKTGGQD